MKIFPTFCGLLALATLSSVAVAAPDHNCVGACGPDGPNCAAGCASAPAADAIKRHPLKGVITSVVVEKSALMVKHEEIPGVMRAMTMMFKVDAATLGSAQRGQAITGLISRQGGDWVLEQVKIVPPAAGK